MFSVSKLRASVLLVVVCVAGGSNAQADEKLWTATTGLSYRDSNFNLPNNKFGNESWSTYLGLSRIIDDKTYIGGSVSYTNADTRYNTLSGSADADTTSLGVSLTRKIGLGLYANGSLGYGKSNVDTKTSVVNYDTDAKFKTVSLGLVQYIPIGQSVLANVSASYNHISTDSDKFLTNLGNAVPSSNNTLNYVTLGSQVSWLLNKWTPFVQLSWNKANRAFIQGTGDDDYFSYSAGTRYAFTDETSVGFTLGSVFDKRDSNETSAGISLSHRF
jgi:outer membrane receptor protein involved in Fe transport